MPDSALSSVWLIWITDFWMKASCYRGLFSQTPVSSFGQESAGSFPVLPSSGQRHKRTLSTFQRKYFHPELLPVFRKSLKQLQRNFCVERSESESLTPPGG
ncbi:hypothetical protein ATANTOWER_019251 [Ataeniobius toweri]|uniref:Uncharacterized protein n=1 Tax=Ataeniobius toweri TaxID=208326 RepID=A0ABU7BGJ6_9TELE|nr:hypothetical protein [Ataeniobius toweri]